MKFFQVVTLCGLAFVATGGSALLSAKRQAPKPALLLGTPVPLPPKPTSENAAPEVGPEQNMTPIVDAAGLKYGYPSLPAVWRYAQGAPKIIFVCWETAGYDAEKAAVKNAVTQTWQASSGLRFSGWGQCTASMQGIRIQIEDSGPHTKGLGNQLNGMPNGMVLNFTYINWSPACQTMKTACNTSIAVHEFGHAIAFSHEQNRPDTPGECAIRRQGSNGNLLLTDYDPHSVMNYCNSEYNNNGRLSQKDVYSVQALYCAPSTPTCKPQF